LYSSENVEEAISAYLREREKDGEVAVLCEEERIPDFERLGAKCLNLGKNEEEMATRLYALLREAESCCRVLIAVEPMAKGGVMTGVLNRLRKACASVDIPHQKV
jgi:hypothetical protein